MSLSIPTFSTTLELIGNADNPAPPMSGFTFLSLGRKRLATLINTTPDTVPKTKAMRPKAIIISVSFLIISSPFINGAIDKPRSREIRGVRIFCAAEESESKTLHSRRRLPNISMPTRDAESGATRDEIIVTAIGNIIFVL